LGKRRIRRIGWSLPTVWRGLFSWVKSEERVEVEAEGFRARSICLGLQVVQRAGFRRRYEKA
jgi:hypothetical protein